MSRMIHSNNSEFIRKRDGTELCRECGHVWSDYGVSHYPECRYYWVEEEKDDEEFEIAILYTRTCTIKSAA